MKAYLLLVGLFIAVFNVSAKQADSYQTFNQMPEWQLQRSDGTIARSQDYIGKPLLLHFWATWCPYCKKLQPGLDKLAKKYQSQGLTVLAVSLQESEGANPQAELKNRGLDLQTLLHGDHLGLNLFKIKGTPTTVFIAPDGRILGSTMDSDPQNPQWDEVAQYLIQLAHQ